jgi:VIT1/CCC1 family predicted Fe2+/Mn2+ transporter
VVPILVLPLKQAIYAALAWGVFLLVVLNYYVARKRKENPLSTILEHVGVAAVVVVVSYYVGRLVAMLLG